MAQATTAQAGPDRQLVDPKELHEFVVKVLVCINKGGIL